MRHGHDGRLRAHCHYSIPVAMMALGSLIFLAASWLLILTLLVLQARPLRADSLRDLR
jgi:hypothetical protein